MSIAIDTRSRAESLEGESARVRRRLAVVRRRVRTHLIVEGIAWTVGVTFLLAAAALAMDWLWRLNLSTRVGLGLVALAVIVWVAWRKLLQPALLRLDDLDLAVLVDRRRPGVGQQVANVLELPKLLDDAALASPSLIVAAVREQAEALDKTDLESMFADGRRMKQLLLAVGTICLIGAFFTLAPAISNLWTRRWLLGSNVRWPQRTYLSVVGLGDGGSLLVPRGEPLLLKVDAQTPFEREANGWRLTGRGAPFVVEGAAQPNSVTPGQVSIASRSDSGDARQATFTHFFNGEFRYELPPVTEPTEMRITGGDDWLAPIMIEPIDRPTIKKLTITSTPFGSNQSETRSVGDAETQLLFLSKTRLELSLTASELLVEASLVGAGSQGIEWQKVDERNYVARWEMSEPLTLEIRMRGQRGDLDSKPYFLSIGRLVDHEPRLTIRSSGVGRRVTPQAKIPLTLRAIDDFGLASLGTELERATIEGGAIKTESKPIAKEEIADAADQKPTTEVDRQPTIALVDLGLSAGTSIKLRGVATDRCSLGAQTGASRWLGFQVVTPEELFFEILMRQRDQRTRFTAALAMAKAQLEILAAIPDAEQASGLLRSQQVITRQVGQIANQLDATLTEMTLNELGTSQARELLATAIIAPMRTLHDESLPKTRPLLEALSGEGASEERRAAAATAQQEIVDTMQKIVTAMSQWESFVDVVNQLRQVIKLQNEMLDTTEKLKKQRTNELFDK